MSFRFFFICLLVFTFSFQGIWSEDSEKSAPGDFQATTLEPKKDELIKKALEVVNKRIAELEKRFGELGQLQLKQQLKSIRASKNKVIILNEDKLDDIEKKAPVSHIKFVEYEFSGNKIKSIKLVYEKENAFETINNFTKTLYIDPAQIENSKIEEKRKEATDSMGYKDFSPDTKYKTLKTLERQLLTAIYKVEILMRNKILKDDSDANSLMQGI